MALPIGLQLYSVREAMKQDYEGTVRKVAAAGFAGVEPAGFPGTTAEKAKKLFDELGLKVSSAHTALPVGENREKVLDEMEAIGCRKVVGGKGTDDFKTADSIKVVRDLFNEAAESAASRGMTFGIHNHWGEFLDVDGVPAYHILLDGLSPDVFFEIDTYWVKVAGRDPAKVVEELGPKVKLLHIKDGPAEHGKPMTAVGKGTMDFPPIVKAGAHAEWLIVELDACATDMLEAVKDSFDYLKSSGLGVGR